MIVHVRCCPALIVTDASLLLCSTQSPEKPSVPTAENASIVKVPGSNVTNWLPETVNVRVSGWALPPKISIRDGRAVAHAGMLQTNLTNRVPVIFGVTAVFGIPLLTLFAALWLHEFDTGLSAPTVSQLAVCLVPCFMSRESANTVGTFAVYIPVSKAEVMTINITRFVLRFVLFARLSVYLARVD